MKQSKKSLQSSKNTRLFEPSASARRFIKRVQNTVHTFSLWEKGDSFLVGVSGGADSLCLLDVLFLLSKKHSFVLSVAHVNYHLRGQASDQDEARVKKAARNYGLPYFVLSSRSKKSVSEETLRDIRYAFFEKIRSTIGATHIAIAHNEDDQAETLLLRLLRGAGLSGLSAMRPKNNFIIRPLLQMSRADILAYLKARAIHYQTDKSNFDPRYLRNRIRHTLIPYLEKKFQPQVRKLLAATAILLGTDYALLEKQPSSFSVLKNKRGITFSRDDLLSLPDPLLRRELRTLLHSVLQGKNPEKNLVGEVVKALKSHKSKIQTVTFKGLKFIRNGARVRLLYL